MASKPRRIKRSGAHGPVWHYLAALLYAFVMCLAYAVAFVPLAALLAFPQGSALKYLALLCPALLYLVILPLRFSFAQALTDRYRSIPFSLQTAFGFSLYGEKVAEGFVYTLHMLKWAIPLALSGGALYYLYANTETFTQAVIDVTALGRAVINVWNGAVNFFSGLFGGGQAIVSGGFGEGLLTLFAVAALGALLILWGAVRNSAYRYIWAEATELDKNPRFEARRSLRGRRWAQLGVALINLALLSPALVALYLFTAPKEAISEITMRFADIMAGESELPVIVIPYGKIAVVFLACYLPLLPLRRMITASFATARLRRASASAQSEAGISARPMPPLYDDQPGHSA